MKPDIKGPGPGYIRQYLPFFGGLILIIGAVTGGVFFYKKHDRSEPEQVSQENIMTEQGMDPSFFSTGEKSESEPELKSSPASTRKQVTKKEKKSKKSVKQKKPKAKDLFLPSDTIKFHDKSIALNNERRGNVGIFVVRKGSDFKEFESRNSAQKEITGVWNEPKTESSLPLDMSRTITVDRFISAVLINEINSELAGKVVAQVENNVFGAHGKKILIPAGSKAIGFYNQVQKIGQERLTVVWERIITPAGINIHTGNAEITDAMGRSGLTGDIDNRYGTRYGMSLLISILTAATSYTMPVRNENQQVAVESFGREQSSLARAILEEHMDIQPRIIIPAGSRILITALKDIWFKKLEKGRTVKVLPVERKEND